VTLDRCGSLTLSELCPAPLLVPSLYERTPFFCYDYYLLAVVGHSDLLATVSGPIVKNEVHVDGYDVVRVKLLQVLLVGSWRVACAGGGLAIGLWIPIGVLWAGCLDVAAGKEVVEGLCFQYAGCKLNGVARYLIIITYMPVQREDCQLGRVKYPIT